MKLVTNAKLCGGQCYLRFNLLNGGFCIRYSSVYFIKEGPLLFPSAVLCDEFSRLEGEYLIYCSHKMQCIYFFGFCCISFDLDSIAFVCVCSHFGNLLFFYFSKQNDLNPIIIALILSRYY